MASVFSNLAKARSFPKIKIDEEEIVLENNNAEIIINEDDLALIRQYMKLQQSAKE